MIIELDSNMVIGIQQKADMQCALYYAYTTFSGGRQKIDMTLHHKNEKGKEMQKKFNNSDYFFLKEFDFSP